MSSSQETTQAQSESGNSGEGLREVLLRLTSPRYAALQEQIEALRGQIDSLQTLETTLKSVELQLTHQDEALDQSTEDLQALLQKAQAEIIHISTGLSGLDESLHAEIHRQTEQMQAGLALLREELEDPEQISQRINPVLISTTDKQVRENEAEYAAAVAPAIGPAIRQQIRNARQDIIDALYPVIGQIVGKAISEELRELTRKIDGQLRSQLNLRSRMQLLGGRLRGVPDAEQLLRSALPYTVQHIFLIHRESGLLLRHLAISKEETEDADLISGMLTAIQDFMRDSFGEEDSELEEVTHGDQRILLEGGQYAYVAVVLEGVEPPGYAGFMRHTVSEINVQHEDALSTFSGEMARLPDFQEPLTALASPTAHQLDIETHAEPLGRSQKWALAGGLAGTIIVLGLLIFGCIFTIRLWPVAFPGPIPTSTPTIAVLATTTQPMPTSTATAVPPDTPALPPPSTTTATAVNTITASPEPTSSFTPEPSPTPTPQTGTLSGDLNVREEPASNSPRLGTILAGEKVLILTVQGEWYRVAWPAEGQPELEGWIWGNFLFLND